MILTSIDNNIRYIGNFSFANNLEMKNQLSNNYTTIFILHYKNQYQLIKLLKHHGKMAYDFNLSY